MEVKPESPAALESTMDLEMLPGSYPELLPPEIVPLPAFNASSRASSSPALDSNAATSTTVTMPSSPMSICAPSETLPTEMDFELSAAALNSLSIWSANSHTTLNSVIENSRSASAVVERSSMTPPASPVPATEFTSFPRLNSLLRAKIWHLAIPDARTIRIHPGDYRDIPSGKRFPFPAAVATPVPAMLHVSKEARLIAQSYYKACFSLRLRNPIYFDTNRDVLYFRNEFDFLAFGEPIWYYHRTTWEEQKKPTCSLQHLMVARNYPFLFLDETLRLVRALQHLKSVIFERVPVDREEDATWDLQAKLKDQRRKILEFGADWNVRVGFLMKCEMEKMANGTAWKDLKPEDRERKFITMTGIYDGEIEMWQHRRQNGHGGRPGVSWGL